MAGNYFQVTLDKLPEAKRDDAIEICINPDGSIWGEFQGDHFMRRLDTVWDTRQIGDLATQIAAAAETKISRDKPIDYAGALLLGITLASAMIALVQIGRGQSLWAPGSLILIAISVLSLLGLRWREHRAADPVLPPALFANRALVLSCSVLGINFLILYGLIVLAPWAMQTLGGAGAGQMSRVDSVEIAIRKAGERVAGSVLSSDAFFPFPDSIFKAAEAGVAAIIQPGGSKKDNEVIAACNEVGIPMILTGRRHFKH